MLYKKTAIAAFSLLVVLALALILVFNLREKTSAEVTVSVTPNQVIESPLAVSGEARWYWFFEASFPAKVFDGNGRELGVGIMQAKSDWMTENFVPFSGTIEFQPPVTATGKLVIQKDNSSGLPENDKQIEIPIRFNKTESQTIQAFFNNSRLDPEFSCNRVFSVTRTIPKTQSVGQAALNELLNGPTQAEKDNGFFTSFNPGVRLQSLVITGGLAKADFDEALEWAVGGSCRVSAIRAQITETLKQFPTVRDVIISINGRTEDILQP